jgi:hypothetical protein
VVDAVPADAGKLSELIGAVVHRATVAAQPHVQAAHDERITTFLEGLEQRVAPMLAPILQQALDDPTTDPAIRELFGVVAAPTHKFDSSLIGIGLTAILYPFLQAALAPHVTSLAQQAWNRDPSQVLSPAELALSQIKGTYDPATAVREAADNGINVARFNVMVANTGEPPGLAELLLLFRRNQITLARLVHGVRQSRVRDEWLPEIQMLRFAPPPAGEVVAGRVKEHLTDAEYRTKLGEAGIDPANAEWMRQAAGRPYGIEQALHLLNRGEIDETRVRAVIAQSDVNTDFTADILNLRWYLPPVRSIMAMLRAGAITDAQATRLFQENGVRATDIPGYLAEAHHGKTASVRTLTEAQVVRLYGAKLIDHPTAVARLTALGVDAPSITLLLDYADNTRHERYVNAVITRVHTRYVAHKLTDTEATNALNADKVPAAAIADLLALWRIERGANVVVPSASQVVGAYRRQDITALECKQRLLALGVQQSDLDIIVADGFPPTKPNPAAVAAVVNA